MYLRNRDSSSLPILPSKNIIVTVRSHITIPSLNIKQQVYHMQGILVSMKTQELTKIANSYAISNFPLTGKQISNIKNRMCHTCRVTLRG